MGTRFSGGKRKRNGNGENGSLLSKIITSIIFISVFSYLLPFLIPIFIIGLVVIFVLVYRSVKKQDDANDLQAAPVKQRTITHDQALQETIRRDVEIMNDCVDLINNSSNFSTVSGRYNTLIEILTKLSQYTAQELQIAGISPKRPFAECLKEIQIQKDAIYNQAIKRAYDRTAKDAAVLKTEKGRQNRFAKFKASVLECETLSQANINYLSSLFDT